MGSFHNVVRFESEYLLNDLAAKGVFLRWDLSSFGSSVKGVFQRGISPLASQGGWEGWAGVADLNSYFRPRAQNLFV